MKRNRRQFRIIIILTLLFAFNNSLLFAQNESGLKTPKNIIKLGVLPDFFQPVIPLYYEHFLDSRLSLQTGFGYLLPVYNDNWDMTGFNFRLSEEIRAYFPERKWYASFETRYLNTKCFTDGSYSYTDNQGIEQYYRERLLIKKQTLSFIPKIGFQSIRNHFSFDMWMGLGAKYRSVRYPGANPQSTIDYRTCVWGPDYLRRQSNKKGDFWNATFVFNITLGYVF